MGDYINYLLNKYLVFDEKEELFDEKEEVFRDNVGNEICDCDKLMTSINMKNDIKSDTDFIKLTKKILTYYLCFEININIDIKDRIKESEAERIFYNYKKYKCSDIRETETYLNLNNELDTSNTEWVESVDVSTSDLIDKYGLYCKTGDDKDNYRYEYKFEFIDKGKKWIFSVYDYLNTNDEFDDENNIYWHIASNTKRGDVIKKFITMLPCKDCC